jgi:predicted metal-dependent peptidase
VGIRLSDLFRSADPKKDRYSRELQAARVRAAHQRSYFAPALFSLVPVETDLIGSMAVDSQWRLYYNDVWVAAHTVEQNASLLIHEVSHLLRDHEERKKAAGINDHRRWNTAGDCEINDDLHAEGLPLPGDPPLPGKFGLQSGNSAENYYRQLPAPPPADKYAAAERERQSADCGSGAHGERRFWELPADDGAEGGVPGVDKVKAELVRREVARRIEQKSPYDGDVPLGWRRWAHATLAPKVDYMASLRHAVRRALRDSTVGRYDRTYRRPHRRQACYGEFIMASF